MVSLLSAITRDLLAGRKRSLLADSHVLLAAASQPPHITGLEYIPASGPFVLVSNHFQRPGLWIGWAGAVLAAALAQVRPDPVHYVVTDVWRLNLPAGRVLDLPGTRAVFARVANMWDMIPMPVEAGDGRIAAVRQVLARALPPPRGQGQLIGIFPEGTAGRAEALSPALPGTGLLFLLLARAGVPVLPAGVSERSGRLVARFGPVFLPVVQSQDRKEQDIEARTQVMVRVAALLPEKQHGVYAHTVQPG